MPTEEQESTIDTEDLERPVKVGDRGATKRQRGRPRSTRDVPASHVLPLLASEAGVVRNVAALKLAGLSDADLATATASSESAVAKWRSATKPTPAARTKLDRVRAAMLYLISHGIDPEGAYGWITGVDPELDWNSPLDLIRLGEFDRVVKRLTEISPREPLEAD